MTKHNYLSGAIRAFEVAAPRYCDFWFEHGSEREFRDAPAPFRVVSFDTTESHVREDGVSWSTGGEVGVALYDATGRCWREAGVIVDGGIGI